MVTRLNKKMHKEIQDLCVSHNVHLSYDEIETIVLIVSKFAEGGVKIDIKGALISGYFELFYEDKTCHNRTIPEHLKFTPPADLSPEEQLKARKEYIMSQVGGK
jgi:hypothetical protein